MVMTRQLEESRDGLVDEKLFGPPVFSYRAKYLYRSSFHVLLHKYPNESKQLCKNVCFSMLPLCMLLFLYLPLKSLSLAMTILNK